ncbi:hypothetical protein [Helicobacter sp. 11S03491-1]|uniref:hypothetical protein n=1 Tax=Helicobacter sp. 11S03491-1 TaxID=1476196 RepID=UPI000BA695C0|nr:hypothetical protein [Helicobacter sp. 11S03491-1]PAF43082.1 hypothetical protein BKH45_03180 [Helicobacter sp. 11S03491-1]
MKKILLLAILAIGILQAQTAYINKTSPLKINGKIVGEITVLTPVEVLQTQGNQVKIKLKGAMDENYTKAIQKSPELGEIYATFIQDDNPFLKVISKKENDYGDLWFEVEGEFEVDKTILDSSDQSLYTKAKTIYEQTCSQCHRLHAPNSFTVNQWPSNINSMKDMVSLDKDTKELITKYLQQHAKDAQNH